MEGGGVCKYEGLVIDVRRSGGLTGTWTGMQVIVSKDAEIEDFKERLKEATDIIAGLQSEIQDLRKQLPEAKRKAAELEADLKKSKVCLRGEGGGAIDF